MDCQLDDYMANMADFHPTHHIVVFVAVAPCVTAKVTAAGDCWDVVIGLRIVRIAERLC